MLSTRPKSLSFFAGDLPCHAPILDWLYRLTGFTLIEGDRAMERFDGSLARTLDFGETTVLQRIVCQPGAVPASRSRPTRRLGLLRGPDKYKVLEHRRRTAQIKARHALDLIELMEAQGK